MRVFQQGDSEGRKHKIMGDGKPDDQDKGGGPEPQDSGSLSVDIETLKAGRLPTTNDGGIYLYMTVCGAVGRMNATPHSVTPRMCQAVRSKEREVAPFVKMGLLWPMLFCATVIPYMIPQRSVRETFSENWKHFALVHPITQVLIFSSVPKLITTVAGVTISTCDQIFAVAMGAFASTGLVMMAGGVGQYPIPFAPLLTTVPSSWLVFAIIFIMVRSQRERDKTMHSRFFTALHIHNIFYVGGMIILLYTMVFRSSGKTTQRFLPVFLPVIRFAVKKSLEMTLIPVSPDLMPVGLLLAEFSVQSLVASMLPGVGSVGTIFLLVVFDLVTNFWHAFMSTQAYLKMKFSVVQLFGGKTANPHVSRGVCWPFLRASIPDTIIVGSEHENPEEKFARHVYNSGVLMSLELADIFAPLIFMSVATLIFSSHNNGAFGLGPNLSPMSGWDMRSGWKWVGLLSSLELVSAIILGFVLFGFSGVNALRLTKIIAADNMDFLARMIFAKYVFILSILMTHSGTIEYLN
ncbi:hypothetical protein BSKO_01174 [Bryopsis sp. KO-2023]|nr:hypothetical protein BSKO_01174 [Bryopsis sp. KO-2023]